MEKKIKIFPPQVPNFLFDEKENSYKIEDFSEAELKEVGAEWTRDLISRARKNRKGETPQTQP